MPAGSTTQPLVSWETPSPQRELPVPGAPHLAFATTGERFVAYLIDVIIIGILSIVVSIVLGVDTRTVNETPSSYFVTSAPNAIIGLVITLLYFVGSWTGGRRATVGQRLLHLQVGNAFDGRALTLEQALSRWVGLGDFLGILTIVPGVAPLGTLGQAIWGLVLLVSTATSPTKQGFHDRFANSAVVRPIDRPASGWVTACLVIGIVVVVIGLLSIVALIFLGSRIEDILSQVGRSV